MPGTNYVALSGLRARVDELDRLASDLANSGTTAYKGERGITASAERDSFNRSLQSAIDTTFAGRRLDTSDGSLAPTGRPLDVAIQGDGFFVVGTPAGPRYTRNGHFAVDSDKQIVTEDGYPVLGANGPIVLGDGEIRVDGDGTIWAAQTKAGQLQVVTFEHPRDLGRDQASRLRADGQTPTPVAAPRIAAGSLEQSNVNVADRLADLTTLSRGFEALQKSLSVLINDVDGRAIDQLGRRS